MKNFIKTKAKLRPIVDKILREDNRPATFEGLKTRVAVILRIEDEEWKPRTPLEDHFSDYPQGDPQLNEDESPVFEEIYWDLFREKQITFGEEMTIFSIHSEASKF